MTRPDLWLTRPALWLTRPDLWLTRADILLARCALQSVSQVRQLVHQAGTAMIQLLALFQLKYLGTENEDSIVVIYRHSPFVYSRYR